MQRALLFSNFPRVLFIVNLLLSLSQSLAPISHLRTKNRAMMTKTRPATALSSNSIPVTPSPAKKRRAKSPLSVKENKVPSTEPTQSLTSTLLATVNPNQPYVDLKISPEELRPSATLTTGQCFHWKAIQKSTPEKDQNSIGKKESAWGSHNATEWVGTIRISDKVSEVVAVKETNTTTLFRPLTNHVPIDELTGILYSYFRLDHSLQEHYQSWSEADARLATIAKCIKGVRIIEQDPFECLIGFICSSNNNIPRITKMLNAIRFHYGKHLITIGEEQFYSFPSLDKLLLNANDQDLRGKCGLGYRSKYVLETLRLLQSYGGEKYLATLRAIHDAQVVQDKLCEFCGVGRKVADCVALFSLRQDDAIPVDVHVWNIARRDYDPDDDLANVKSLTPTTYRQVGDLFRSRFKEKAGWAHSLLFVAELPSFRPVLPKKIVEEMDAFKHEEKMRKEEKKKTKKTKTLK